MHLYGSKADNWEKNNWQGHNRKCCVTNLYNTAQAKTMQSDFIADGTVQATVGTKTRYRLSQKYTADDHDSGTFQ